MFYEKLIKIGFTKKEANIYIELLKIGPQAVSTIANRLSMNRTTVYSLIKSLEKKGVLGSYKNEKVKFYLANDPNCLIGLVDRKCKTYNYYRSELLNIIPKIREISSYSEFNKPIVSYHEGKEAIEQIIHEAKTFSGELFLCIRDDKGNVKLEKRYDKKLEKYNHIVSVYKDKISILHSRRGNEYAVVIKSKEIADIHKIIFNVARNGFNIGNDES